MEEKEKVSKKMISIEMLLWDIGEILQKRGYQNPLLVGEGAFSRVYRVWDIKRNRMVACKVSSNHAMLAKEAVYLAQIKHPLFVSFFDYFVEKDIGILVMEYVYGCGLDKLLCRRGKMSVPQTIRIGMDLADGLKYLHEREKPLVYRDLKPENIMIREDGAVKLIDMGCVGERGCRGIAGSRGYAAPEQLLGNAPADAYTDIYGLGKVLLQVLPSKAPENLRRILERCTRAEREDRIPDMRFLMHLLVPYDKTSGRIRCGVPFLGHTVHDSWYHFRCEQNTCLFSTINL